MDDLEKNIDNFVYIRGNEEYEVKGWIYWNKNIPIVYDSFKPNTEEIIFIFDKMNQGLWDYVENNILTSNIGSCEYDIIFTYDFVKLKKFIVSWMLKRWNIPIELKRKPNGELTEESYSTVMRVHSNIMRYYIGNYENTLFLDEKNKNMILKQANILFHPKSKGVSNPHEAISQYCNLSGFWDKFGLNYFDIQRIPHDLFVNLKTVMSAEISIRSQEIENIRRQSEKNKNMSRRR